MDIQRCQSNHGARIAPFVIYTICFRGFVQLFVFVQMASRVTWQVAGGVIMFAGIVGKVGAALSTIPDPVLGGVMIIGLGMIITAGLANLESVDMRSGRNMMVLGTSLILGLMIPSWMRSSPGMIKSGEHKTIWINNMEHTALYNLM